MKPILAGLVCLWHSLFLGAAIPTALPGWIDAQARGLDGKAGPTASEKNTKLINALIAEGTAIWLGPGEYWFNDTIDFSGASAIRLSGCDPASVQLHFKAVDPAKRAAIYYKGSGERIRPVFENFTVQCHFDGISSEASGIYLEQTISGGSTSSPRLTAVVVRRSGSVAKDVSSVHAFWVGFYLRGWGSPEFHDCDFQGLEPYQVKDSKVAYAHHSYAGFLCDDNSLTGKARRATLNPQWFSCSVYATEYAVVVTGENEGGKIIAANFQEVNYGVLIDHVSQEGLINSQPYFTMSDSHVNSNRGAVIVRNGRMGHFHNNHFYQKVTSDAKVYKFFEINGPVDGLKKAPRLNFMHQIIGNYMQSTGCEGISYGVWVDNAERVIVMGNQFASIDHPVFLGEGTANCDVSLGNMAYVHPQEKKSSAKQRYVPADFCTNSGRGNRISLQTP